MDYIIAHPEDPDFEVVNREFVLEFIKSLGIPEDTYHIRHEGDGGKSVAFGGEASIYFSIDEPTIFAVHDWRKMGSGDHFEVPVDDPEAVEKVKSYFEDLLKAQV